VALIGEMSKQSSKKADAPVGVSDEQLFWRWAVDQGATWYRYSPDVARALASPHAALMLAAAIHKSCIRSDSIHAQGRWFYMSARDWMRELVFRECDVVRALSLLCVDVAAREIRFKSERAGAGRVRRARVGFGGLGLMHRQVASRSARGAAPVSHYRVDFERLRAWWVLNGIGQTVAPISSDGGYPFPQTEDIHFLKLRKSISSSRGSQLALVEDISVEDRSVEVQASPQQNTHTEPNAPSAPGVCVDTTMVDGIYRELVLAGIWSGVAHDLAAKCSAQGWKSSEVRMLSATFAESSPIILRREIESLIAQGRVRL
jgi:hypothetical protein